MELQGGKIKTDSFSMSHNFATLPNIVAWLPLTNDNPFNLNCYLLVLIACEARYIYNGTSK